MMKEVLKKHGDTLAIISVIFSSFFWINGKFDAVYSDIRKIEDKLTTIEKDVDYIKKLKIDERLSGIEKDVDRIKTVLIMQRVWPDHLAEKKIAD